MTVITLVILCLLPVITLLQHVDSCESGRLLVGTVTKRRLTRYNGVYVLQPPSPEHHHAVYKHDSKNRFLYLLRSTHRNYFVFSREAGRRNQLDIMLETAADSPDEAVEPWAGRLFNQNGGYWSTLTDFRVTCVDETRRTCQDNEDIILYDPRPHINLVPHLGRYTKEEQLLNERFVYKQEGGSSYLFSFSPGVWMIGPEPGSRRGSVIVRDYAYQAEYISGEWLLGTHRSGFRRMTHLRVLCSRRS